LGARACQDAPAARNDTIEQDRPDEFYCGERRLGQWFYCAKPKPMDNAKPATPVEADRATDRIAAIAKQLDELKAGRSSSRRKRTSSPMSASSASSSIARRPSRTPGSALWQNPDLDYTLQRPVSTVGKRVAR
jgi:conjugal transfer pilus assembly protein TraF